MASISLFCRRQEIYRNKLTGCIAVLLAWLIMRHRFLERFLKDHGYLEPYFHQNYIVVWVPYPIQFLKIVTFLSNCTSGNSYSLIVFQNYLDLLVVLTQDFPLMRSSVISQSMLRRLDLNFLNSLSPMLNFFAISILNHSLLVFFILVVFKGAISLTTSINFWKKLSYVLFILWYFS